MVALVAFLGRNAVSIFFVAILLMALAACTTTPKGSFCALATAQRPSQEVIDKLSDEEVSALLRHNRLGGKLCGWKP